MIVVKIEDKYCLVDDFPELNELERKDWLSFINKEHITHTDNDPSWLKWDNLVIPDSEYYIDNGIAKLKEPGATDSAYPNVKQMTLGNGGVVHFVHSEAFDGPLRHPTQEERKELRDSVYAQPGAPTNPALGAFNLEKAATHLGNLHEAHKHLFGKSNDAPGSAPGENFENKNETLQAKLRNRLTPFWNLVAMADDGWKEEQDNKIKEIFDREVEVCKKMQQAILELIEAIPDAAPGALLKSESIAFGIFLNESTNYEYVSPLSIEEEYNRFVEKRNK